MKHGNVQEMFYQAADSFGSNIAISWSDKRVTYSELEEKSNKLANFLLASGASKGSIVAIFVEDRIEAISSILGLQKAGCVFVPLDTSLPEERLKLMIEGVSPEWFVIESKFLGRISQIASSAKSKAKIIFLDTDNVSDDKGNLVHVSGFPAYKNSTRPVVTSGPDDMCYIYFTSGSTGTPKRIAGRLKGIDHFIRWEIESLNLGPETRVSQLLPLSFDGSLRDIFVPLCAGGTICVPDGREALLDARKLIKWIDQQGINIVHCVPSVFRSIVNEVADPSIFKSLNYILMAGEPLLPHDVGRWVDVFGDRVQLINLYGTSETTMAKFIYFVQPSDRDRQSIPVGTPMPGARALVVDEKGGACPSGVIGEIYIRTPYRSLGYYNQPELTNEAFIQNPFSDDPNDIVYKTGDLGRVLEDGNFEFLGRKDQQVKIRGVRVEMAEVENLLRNHEAVQDVAVIDQEDPSSNRFLCAFVVLGKEIQIGELRDYLMVYLPDYMIPSAFLVMDQLPRTISGKVDRRALPTIGQALSKREESYVAPRTPVEEVLAGIWARVLGLKQVSVNDNFFEMGGHSLLATQIISRIRHVFNVELPLLILFEAPALYKLAEKIDEALKAGIGQVSPIIEKATRDQELPLSFAQQRLWFVDQLEPGSPAYNINNTSRLQGRLNLKALEQALSEVERRHEALRTTFTTANGRPVQIIASPRAISPPMVDLTKIPQSEREEVARGLASQQARQSFDLSQGPLMSVALVKLDDQDHVLLLTMHHIVGDAWSTGVLFREVAVLYNAFSAGQPSSLTELLIQYPDFAMWQRQWLQGEVLEAQLSYWKQQLGGRLPTLELPTDRPRPATLTYRGAVESLVIDLEMVEALKKLSNTEGVTLFMTLLAAFNALLYRYTGQEDMIVGTDVANRNHADIEGLIGFFINQLVLRTNLSGNPTFRELLGREREVALAAYAHQDFPFERIVEELKPERDLSRTPLFQVKILLQNVPQALLYLPDLTFSSFGADVTVAPFDLVLSMVESPEGLIWDAVYNTDLFEANTVKQMLTHLRFLLERVLANPDQRLADLSILSDAEMAGHVATDFPGAGLSQRDFENLVLEISKHSGGQ